MVYVIMHGVYEVYDDAGNLLCYVRKQRKGVWVASAQGTTRRRTAQSRSEAVRLMLEVLKAS